MFNNTIFTINSVNREEEKHIARISFDPHHEIFRGHFPDKKVVPGVMLMQMVKETVQKILGLKDSMITEAGMKFLNPVLVDESSDLEVEMTIERTDDGSYKIKSIGKDRDKKSFKINITIK